jgi:prephenate dehydrogenase
MTVNIAIIGIGQIGGSIGLALADHRDQLFRIGYDKQIDNAKQAEKAGAIDKVYSNLIKAVDDADIVILALPIDQLKNTLQVIAPHLKENSVIMDTSPVKEIVANWMSEFLPAGRFYVGLTPVINPAYLLATESGFPAAHADLFKQGLMGIVTPPQTPSEAIKLATDLVTMLNAQPYYADLLEMDGLIASTQLLPQILAVALMNTTSKSPGWSEAKKVAGRYFALVTKPLIMEYDPATLSEAFLAGKPNTIRLVDDMIMSLELLKEKINQTNEVELKELVAQAIEANANWLHQRQKMSWMLGENPMEVVPTSKEMLGRIIGYRKKHKTKPSSPK